MKIKIKKITKMYFLKVTEVKVQNGNVSWHISLLFYLEHSNHVSRPHLLFYHILVQSDFKYGGHLGKPTKSYMY
jgi:hypothetical protein